MPALAQAPGKCAAAVSVEQRALRLNWAVWIQPAGKEAVGAYMVKIGIQGEPGSACDEAAALLASEFSEEAVFVYLTDARGTLEALARGLIAAAVIALESPVGTPVDETAEALACFPAVCRRKLLSMEVKHSLMIKSANSTERIQTVASHPVPLKKHRDFLISRFAGYREMPLADTGLAAKMLADGKLPPGTAVIAMPRAAELFGLSIIERELPANDNYLTQFALVEIIRRGQCPA